MKITGVFFFVALAAVLSAQDVLSSTLSPTEENLAAELSYEIAKWMAAGLEEQPHHERLSGLTLSRKLRSSDTTSLTCTACGSVVRVVQNYILNGMTEASIVRTLTHLCVSINLQTEEVCRGIIELNAPIAFYIVENKPSLTPDSVCGMILHKRGCVLTDEEYEWTVDIDEGERQYINSEETDDTLKIIHISDLHYDPVYEPFGNAYCDVPTCCRKGQNDTNTSGKVAGYWGDYNDCDSPWHAIEDVIDRIAESEEDIEYIYFTGDIIDHGIWETSRDMITESIVKTYTKLFETFGSVPVYPIIGNHESNPTNVFATIDVTDERVYTAWLYELIADLWIGFGWLPESTRYTIMKGGYYTVSPKEGFRVIAMNDNVCYTLNWWLLYEARDPSDQLQWLADTLLQAELDGEYVHILAHMPPGASSCQATWGREYRKITDRFSHIITSEFNGHTHNDEFRVVYGLKNPLEPVRVTWVAGGVTTYSDVNPNYKVFTVNEETYVVKDYDNWMYNLTLANETPEKNPVWYKSYSFKEEYGLEDLSLSSLDGLMHRMAADTTIIETYYYNYVKQADALVANGCDESCRINRLCSIVTAIAADSTQCVYFSNLI